MQDMKSTLLGAGYLYNFILGRSQVKYHLILLGLILHFGKTKAEFSLVNFPSHLLPIEQDPS